MKVQTEQQQVIGLTKVAKGRASREERDVSQGGAIQGLLDKLKDLVPNMPRSKKLTRLEIIQNVIDYILDLEIALEAHPTQLSSSAPAVSTRQPLGVLPPANNSATNALSEDEHRQLACLGGSNFREVAAVVMKAIMTLTVPRLISLHPNKGKRAFLTTTRWKVATGHLPTAAATPYSAQGAATLY
ncbi:hypothetical protein HPB52_008607 [Rhipicephalus sanguineus]|uniref:BHLH domain-containing protein n=1 Tax=Rhipicephalus sanguineus TaxID=34632 RepID=A0A9D4QD44_RHISA|nr:hypothetical protein HPB52_008607 [Rhipicephalus sanguineus]